MYLKKNISLALVLSIILSNAFAVSGYAKEFKINDPEVKNVADGLKAMCNDPNRRQSVVVKDKNGEELTYFIVHILRSDDDKREPATFDCRAFNVGPIKAAAVKALGKQCVNCAADAKVGPDATGLKSLENVTQTLQNSCDKDEKKSLASCTKDIGCNALRSMMNAASTMFTGGSYMLTANLKSQLEKSKGASSSCTSANRSDCVTETVAGILKDIWFNVDGLLTLTGLKAAGKKVVGWVRNEKVQQVENKTSESLHAASQQSPSAIDQFKEHPVEFVTNMGSSIYNMVMNAIGQSYGCGKWSGAPYTSKCLEVSADWKCTDCNQRANMFCGVAGVVGGEIVIAYLTGNALNLAGKAGWISKISGLYAKNVTQVSAMVASANQKGGAAKAAATVATAAGKGIVATGKGALWTLNKTFNGLAKVPGLKQFINVTNDAFMAGLYGPKQFMAMKAAEKASKKLAIGGRATAAYGSLLKDDKVADAAEAGIKVSGASSASTKADDAGKAMAPTAGAKTAGSASLADDATDAARTANTSSNTKEMTAADLEKIDVSYITPEMRTKYLKDYKKSIDQIADALPESASLTKQKKQDLVVHAIRKMETEKRLTKEQIDRELYRVINSCSL